MAGAFGTDRQGVVVGAKLAQRFGWKIGDHIPLKAPGYLGGEGWDFNLRAIYRGTRPNDDESQLWLQHKYFYEKAPRYWQGLVGWYVVRVTSPDRALGVAKAIDGEFANSSSETRAQTESAFATSFMKQMGNIEFLILAIGTVVFFTLLLVTGNTMAIAVRERTGELAVLKSVGYSDRFVLGLVLAESLADRAPRRRLGPVAGARHGGAGHHGRAAATCTCRRPRSAPALAVTFVTGLLSGVLPAIERDAPERRRRAAEGLKMAIPVAYNLRSARERWSSSVVAVIGIAGTVGRLRRHARPGARLQGHCRLLRPARQRDRAARRGRQRDDEHPDGRATCASSRTRPRWPATATCRWSAPRSS